MRVANDLNTYTPQGTAIGDFRITDPVNCWDGASGDVIIFQRFVGGHDWQFQIGVDAVVTDTSRAPDLFARMRFREEPWGEWTAAGGKPPPDPEPPPEETPPPEVTPPPPESEE